MKSNLNPILGAQPYFGDAVENIITDVRKVIISGNLTHGEYVVKFENEFSKISGTKHSIAVSSGGTALELILKALNVKGKEVIVPTDTFVATANAVLLAGGKPVFADISRQTLALTPESVRKLIKPETAAVITVHMFGLIAPDLPELKEICQAQNIHLIEDAAHAHGAVLNGEAAGSIGIAGAFSFYPTKVMTTGEGGIITTNSNELAEKLKILRNHGKSLTEPVFEEISNNYRLAEIPAILGYHQLHILSDNITARRKIAGMYRSKLGKLKNLILLPEFDTTSNVFWRYPILVEECIDRLAMQKYLETEFNVRVNWMYEPLCHQQPVFVKNCATSDLSLPDAEWCMKQLLCLPCYPGLSDEDVHRVIEGICSFLEK